MSTVRSISEDRHRPLPADLDTEIGLLGTVLLYNNAMAKVAGMVDADDFFEEIHKRIWDVADEMVAAGRLANPLTMRPYLGDITVNNLPIGKYLALLAGQAGPMSSAPEYARIIKDLATRRRMIGLCDDTRERLYEARVSDPVEKITSEFEDQMQSVRPRLLFQSEFVSFDRLADEVLVDMNELYQQNGAIGGLTTGLSKLDDQLGGLHGGDLIILGGRPGSGKTALAGLIAKANGKANLNKVDAPRVGFLSLEMPGKQLVQRMLGESSGVAPSKLRKGTFDAMEFEFLSEVARDFRGLPIFFDEAKHLTLQRLVAKVRREHKRRPFGLLVLDYIQLMHGSQERGKKEMNRNLEVSEITGGLKQLAVELNIPVVALSQLSRDLEKRDNKRPFLSDLRDSGSIEQDADVVIFCYREEYYLRKQAPMRGTEQYAQWEADLNRVKGQAELIVAKNRHGAEFTVNCGFVADMMRFEDHSPEVEVVSKPTREAKAKKPSLTKDALIAYDVMRDMSRSHVAVITLMPRTEHPKPKLILQSEFRRVLAEQMNEPLEGFEKPSQKLFKELRAANLAYTAKSTEGEYYYLAEMCGK